MGAIFLSASVPNRPPYDRDLRPQEIHAAVNALTQVVLGRRLLVWGGHPAITPLFWTAAESIGVDYTRTVRLFQSRLFEEDFPEENKNFANVIYVDAIEKDRNKSLLAMREKMLTSTIFEAAVFIGGMEGVFEEYLLFRRHWPKATCIALASTGGAAASLSAELQQDTPEGISPLNFVALLHHGLAIKPSQMRNNPSFDFGHIDFGDLGTPFRRVVADDESYPETA